MTRQKIADVLKSGKILVSDGAWGTFLYQKGLNAGECPDEWSITHYDVVKDIAKNYIDAGADMVETNSFGANRFKLQHFGLQDKVVEINEAAARASREAAGENHYVIASVGPTGKMLLMGDVTEEELYDCFREQAVALETGGVDAVCIETMSDADEAVQAIKATKENTNLEVIATFTFDKTLQGDYRTMMGLSPSDTIRAALDAGADIIGTNCGNGMERMIDIVKEIHAEFPDALIIVQANAGLPMLVNGVDTFPETPEMMAALVTELLRAGANIVGGCCGTTPEHIRAMKKAVERFD